MKTAYIAFGSNQGDSFHICSQAVDLLQHHPQIQVLRVSSFYRTKPVGFTEQDWFINGVVELETALSPESLLNIIQGIENDFGRSRQMRWGPRTLDLDILSFGDSRISLPFLEIPHPRLHERLFVLIPLAEIAPEWIHPALGLTVSQLLAKVSEQADHQEVNKIELRAS